MKISKNVFAALVVLYLSACASTPANNDDFEVGNNLKITDDSVTVASRGKALELSSNDPDLQIVGDNAQKAGALASEYGYTRIKNITKKQGGKK